MADTEAAVLLDFGGGTAGQNDVGRFDAEVLGPRRGARSIACRMAYGKILLPGVMG